MIFEVERTYDSHWDGEKDIVFPDYPRQIEINTLEELRDFVHKVDKENNLFEPNTVVISFAENDKERNWIEIYNGYRE